MIFLWQRAMFVITWNNIWVIRNSNPYITWNKTKLYFFSFILNKSNIWVITCSLFAYMYNCSATLETGHKILNLLGLAVKHIWTILHTHCSICFSFSNVDYCIQRQFNNINSNMDQHLKELMKNLFELIKIAYNFHKSFLTYFK